MKVRCFVNGILCDKYKEHCGIFRISNPELGANFLKPNGELISKSGLPMQLNLKIALQWLNAIKIIIGTL